MARAVQRIGWALVLSLVVTGAPAPGWAQKIGVLIYGDDATKVSKQVAALAPSHLAVESSAALVDAMARQGATGDLGPRISQAARRGDLVDAARAAALQLSTGLMILGEVSADKGASPSVWLLVVQVTSGAIEIDERVSLAAKKTARRKKKKSASLDFSRVRSLLEPVWSKVAVAPSSPAPATSAAPAAASAPGQTTADTVDWGAPAWAGAGSESQLAGDTQSGLPTSTLAPVESVSPRRRRPGLQEALVLVSPTYQFTFRSFGYSGQKTANLRPYRANGVSLPGLDAQIYPLGFMEPRSVVWRGPGLHLRYQQAVGLKSVPKDDKATSISTVWRDVSADLRWRIPVSAVVVTPHVGYNLLDFTFRTPSGSGLADEVPEVSYRYVRAGVHAYLAPVPFVALLVDLAYDHVLATGRLGEEYFPKATAYGLDAEAGVAIVPLSFLAIEILGSYRQINHDLRPEAGAEYVAQKATDRYYGARLEAVVFF